VLPRKTVHNWVEKFSQGHSKVGDDEKEVAETTVKRLLCCGFRRTGKAMGQEYQFFSGSNITCFAFYNHL
jgi:myo-inositol-1-phosphate synthase